MELIFNDCSIHGQFHDLTTFRDAIGRVMAIRETARQFGRELHCHRNVANAQVTHDMRMSQAVQAALSRDQVRALMQWLNRYGPFWDDDRQHGVDDWFEYNGAIVTDTAVGEAAYRLFHEIPYSLVSMNPSCWTTSPLSVVWHDNRDTRRVDVLNYWDADELQVALAATAAPLASWTDLEVAARSLYRDLTFSQDSFEPLNGLPFAKGVAENLFQRLNILHDFKNCFDERGERTSRGHDTYQQHFTGDKAWFSDSTDWEKSAFRQELTFPHPVHTGEYLFCTWHGKVKTPQLRIHFSWPIRANAPLYVVYVGPKITKR